MKSIVALSLFGTLMMIGCSQKESSSSGSSFPLTQDSVTVAGIAWSYSTDWGKLHEMPMRVATYVVPSGLEDVEPGECSVFYFGKDQGGDVDMNIQRWGTQFEGASEAQKTTSTVNGIEVVTVRILGTYLAPTGPNMESQGKKPGYKLLGAIVQAPEGMVFFKFTGPALVVEKHEDAFVAMILSIKKS